MLDSNIVQRRVCGPLVLLREIEFSKSIEIKERNMKQHILAAVAVAAAMLSVTASAATSYSTITAPDAESRLVLAHPFTSVNQWKNSSAGMDLAVHASFPQIIEQNFAKLDAKGSAALLHSLSDLELAHLSQLYTNAVTDAGGTAHLHNILASRLEAPDLARVSKYFGYAAMAVAINNVAPQKLSSFGQLANAEAMGPMPGARLLTLGSPGAGANILGLGQFLNYTPYEVYLSFRTAPVGALGVTGAIYESGVIFGMGVTLAAAAGYKAGTVLSGLIQTYDPSLNDAIGGTITEIITQFQTNWNATQIGVWQQTLGTTIPMTTQQRIDQITHGGDFGVSADWEFSVGEGGGSCGFDRSCDLQ